MRLPPFALGLFFFLSFRRSPAASHCLPLEGKVDSGVSRKPEDG